MVQTTASLRGCSTIAVIVTVCLIGCAFAKDDARPAPGCTAASSSDTIIGMTEFMGNKNTTDSLWHDEVPNFRQYGPLSKLTMFRAFFYDGLWHDPGELKGMQFWYGPKQQPPIYTYYDGDANLFGARKPHLPQEFNLAPDEVITRVELQWDPISMRYAAFSTNKGRVLSWGFKDVPGSTKAAVEAPVPGAYVAAFRGFEGKPAPVAKKRYIIQLSVVWAVPSCKPPGSRPSGSIPLESSRLANNKNAQGPTNIYLWDKETVDLLPQGIEGTTVIYEGVKIVKPAEGSTLTTDVVDVPPVSAGPPSAAWTGIPAAPAPAVATEAGAKPGNTQPAAAADAAAKPISQQAALVAPKVAAAKPSASDRPVASKDTAKDAYSKDGYSREFAAPRTSMHKLKLVDKAAQHTTAQQPAAGALQAAAGDQKSARSTPRVTSEAYAEYEPAQQPVQGQKDAWAGMWSTLLG